MKIGVDIRSLEEEPSGVSEYTENLLKRILELDKQNQYYLFYNAFKQPVDHLKSKFSSANCRFIFFNVPNKLFNFSQIFLRSPKIDKLIGDLDLFFMPNLNFAAFSRKIKTIVTVHDLSFKYLPRFFSFKRRLWHVFVRPKRIYKKASRLIAVSQNTKKDVIKLFKIPADKIKVVYPGINIEKKPLAESAREEIRGKYDLGKNFILSLCNLEPRKNIESIILAYEAVRQRGYMGQLVICGKPSWSYRKIFQLAKKSFYQKDIKFLGYVETADKSYLYQMSDVFVYPSYYEGFGFPPLESMVCGTPVITSFHSSLPEVVKDAALLVDPYDINEIVEAITICLSDKNLSQEMKRKGENLASSFSWTQAAQSTLDLFNQLAEEQNDNRN